MKKNKKFSVLFCVNKDHAFLDAAIDSVLNQSYKDFEFLIAANNCSNELYIKLQIYEKSDTRIKLYRTNIGQLTFNLNYLANIATGDYLVRMDSDDICLPERFKILHDFANNSNDRFDVIGSGYTIIDENNKKIYDVIPPQTMLAIKLKAMIGNPFCHPTVMLKRQWLINMKGYSGGFASEDKELWIRAITQNAQLTNIPNILLNYRIHSDQSSRSVAGYIDSVNYWLNSIFAYKNLSILFYSLLGYILSIIKILLLPLLYLYNRIRFKIK